MQNLWRIGPTHVDLNITNGCNLACVHCHSSSGDKLENEMTTEQIIATLDQLHSMGTMHVAIAGGEPFIRRDIVDILDHACHLPGWNVGVITNGLFFRRDGYIEELKARCPGLRVNVSLDGSTPEGFHILRRQPRRDNADPAPMFQQICEGIEALVAADMIVAVNMTLSAPTIQDFLPTYDLVVNRLGAASLVGIKFFPGGYGKSLREVLDIPYAMWAQDFVALTRAKISGEFTGLQISVPAAWEFYLPLIEASIDVSLAEKAWAYSAPLRQPVYANNYALGDSVGIAEIAIAGDGTVYPSILLVGLPEMVVGNVREQRLDEIWQASPILNGLRQAKLVNIPANCARCPLASVCGAGSRARALSVSGDLFGADAACPIIDASLTASETSRIDQHHTLAAGAVARRTLGVGPSAVRVYLDQEGCQIRASGHVFSWDTDAGGHVIRIIDELNASPSGAVAAMQPSNDADLIRSFIERLMQLDDAPPANMIKLLEPAN